MKPRFKAPPYQPRWILSLQVNLLRRYPRGPFAKQTMIITTTGRKTGQKHAVPIDYIRDGDTYLAVNMGGKSNWYRNALANPYVTLEIGGHKIEVCAEPVPLDTLAQVCQILDAYQRERPRMVEGFFDITDDTPSDELVSLGQFAAFMRFRPLA